MGTFKTPADKPRADMERVARALADRSDDICRAIAAVCHFQTPGVDRRSGEDRRVNQLGSIGKERRSGQDRRLPPQERLRRLQKELGTVSERSSQVADLRRISSFTRAVFGRLVFGSPVFGGAVSV